jgi:prolyl 4-hydroxylase
MLEKYGQRVSTMVVYLNNVAGGGETVFPELSLTVSPQKGGGVYFSYSDKNGELDRRSLHGGAPVLGGEKWIATLWWRGCAQRNALG